MNFLLPSLPDMSKPKLAAEIARQLHKFHKVAIPGSREPQLWSDILNFLDKGSSATDVGLLSLSLSLLN